MKNQYREMAKEIGRDVGSLARGGLKEAGKLAVKAAYPVLGNLSANIQGRLEDRLGSDVYCGEKATEISTAANFLSSYLLGVCLVNYLDQGKNFSDDNWFSSMGVVPFVFVNMYTVMEGLFRIRKAEKNNKSVASVLGKAVSLPFDVAKYVSDKAYGYLGEVRGRVEGRKGLDVGGGE